VTLSESPSYLDDDLVVLAARVAAAERGLDDPADLLALRFGVRLRYLRSERGLQQAEVADRTRGRVSQGTVSRLESGRTVVRLDALYALADALAVHPTELLDP
jgi:hypothetical protein